MRSLQARRKPKRQPCPPRSVDCCSSGLRIDPNTSNRGPNSSEYRSDPAEPSAALPTASPGLPIVDCSPATPDTAPDPCHSGDDRPTMPGLRCSGPTTTTRRSCCKDHDKPPPADTSMVDRHSKFALAWFESPRCQAHKPSADKNGSTELSLVAPLRDKNHPVARASFANHCIL